VIIAVTGGNGKLGKAVVSGLKDAGHTVVTLDRVGQREDSFAMVDFTDYGQTVDALSGINERHDGLDAVVHLAAIPAPGLIADSETFHVNMIATFNVFQAARRAGIKRIVYASSETLLGPPFTTAPPYIPVDEEYDSRPESMYAVVKHLEEELAKKLIRWDPDLSITALRFSNVMSPEDYAAFPSYDTDPLIRKWNLWGYIDARDGAQAVLKSLEKRGPGFETFIIAAADTVMTTPNAELVKAVFPDAPITGELGINETLLSIGKARRLLGYEPQHHWRDHV
jgi:nucleoside-diphosphate-sugar epimerase